MIHIENELFYYQKGGIDCGTPDNTIVSTKELRNELNFNIYPNPTSSKFLIEFQNKSNYKIEILNSNGRVIDTIEEYTERIQYDCSLFNSGLYIISISTNEFTRQQKIIIK